MLRYIYKDIQASLHYLPSSCIAGVIVFVILTAVNIVRKIKGKEKLEVITSSVYYTYIMVMLYITFLSREAGERKGMDLTLFSTWGSNARNHAFVIENILLFIPYGFLSPIALEAAEQFTFCAFIGAATSFEIELMQLISGRGYFQIDDIVTNLLGTIIGFIIFKILFKKSQRKYKPIIMFLQMLAHLAVIAALLTIMRYV